MRRSIPVKTDDNQPALLLVDLRDRLIRNRTLLANAIRNYLTEYGLIAAKNVQMEPLLERILADGRCRIGGGSCSRLCSRNMRSCKHI